MSAAAEQIKPILRRLPQRDRAELAHFLLHSLGDDQDLSDSQRQKEPLDDVLTRRLQETMAGAAVNEPIDQALAELRRLLP